MGYNYVNQYAEMAQRLRVSTFYRTPQDVVEELNFYRDYTAVLEKELEEVKKSCRSCRWKEEKKQKKPRRWSCFSWITRFFRRGKSVDNDEFPLIIAESDYLDKIHYV